MPSPDRDGADALTTRLDGLLDRLEAVRARAREVEELTREGKSIEAQIEQVRLELERRAASRRRNLLDDVRIASPCSADWDAMSGDERTRFCRACGKNVHNLSAMTRDDAEGFLRGLVGDACVRIYRRADDTVLTADCPVGAQRKQRRRVALSLVGGGLLAGGALLSQRPADVASVEGPGSCALARDEAERARAAELQAKDEQDRLQRAKLQHELEQTGQHRVTAGGISVRRPSELERKEAELASLLLERNTAADLDQRRTVEARLRAVQKAIKELRQPPRPGAKCACEPGDPLCSCL
jgi:hypothetical protein